MNSENYSEGVIKVIEEMPIYEEMDLELLNSMLEIMLKYINIIAEAIKKLLPYIVEAVKQIFSIAFEKSRVKHLALYAKKPRVRKKNRRRLLRTIVPP